MMKVILKAVNIVVAVIFTVTSTSYGVPRNIWESKQKDVGAQYIEPARLYLDPAKLTVPENFGSITERFRSAGTENSQKLIIQIQDSHCNYEAQTNIQKIIETLSADRETAGALKLIAAEGAQGLVDPTFMRSFPDRKIKAEASDYFVRIGWLTGPEFYAVNFKDEPLPLFGIEEKKLYDENLELFRKSKTGMEREKEFLRRLTGAIETAKQMVFSGDLAELIKMRERYDRNEIKFTEFCVYLSQLAFDKTPSPFPLPRGERVRERVEVGIFKDPIKYPNLVSVLDSIQIEKKIDPNKIDPERKSLIGELQKKMVKEEISELVKQSLYLRTGKITSDMFYSFLKDVAAARKVDLSKYPNLSGYMEIVFKNAAVNAEKLYDEVDGLQKEIKERLYANDSERELDEMMDDAKILKNLADLKMTRKDLACYKERKRDIKPRRFTGALKKVTTPGMIKWMRRAKKEDRLAAKEAESTPSADTLENEIAWLESNEDIDFTNCEKFYDAALKRDQVLAQNTIEEMEKRKATAVAVVTGGFHTQGLKELFKAKGYSYVIVTPRMTQAYDDKVYLARMLNEQSEFDKLFANTGNRITAWSMFGELMSKELIEKSFVAYAEAQAAPAKKYNILEEWKDNVREDKELSKDPERVERYIRLLDEIKIERVTDSEYTVTIPLPDGSHTVRSIKIADGKVSYIGEIRIVKADKQQKLDRTDVRLQPFMESTMEAVKEYPPEKPSQCVAATRFIIQRLAERGIACQERQINVAHDRSGNTQATTNHTILETVLDGRALVIDTQALQFKILQGMDLGLTNDFVSQHIYLADEYYRMMPAYETAGVMPAAARIMHAAISAEVPKAAYLGGEGEVQEKINPEIRNIMTDPARFRFPFGGKSDAGETGSLDLSRYDELLREAREFMSKYPGMNGYNPVVVEGADFSGHYGWSRSRIYMPVEILEIAMAHPELGIEFIKDFIEHEYLESTGIPHEGVLALLERQYPQRKGMHQKAKVALELYHRARRAAGAGARAPVALDKDSVIVFALNNYIYARNEHSRMEEREREEKIDMAYDDLENAVETLGQAFIGAGYTGKKEAAARLEKIMADNYVKMSSVEFDWIIGAIGRAIMSKAVNKAREGLKKIELPAAIRETLEKADTGVQTVMIDNLYGDVSAYFSAWKSLREKRERVEGLGVYATDEMRKELAKSEEALKDVRYSMALALVSSGFLNDEAAIKTLADIDEDFEEDKENIKDAVQKAMEWVKNPGKTSPPAMDSVSHNIVALYSADAKTGTRFGAAMFLGNYAGRRDAVNILVATLNDGDEAVRREAAGSLAKIGSFEVIEALNDAVKNGKLQKERAEEIRGKIVQEKRYAEMGDLIGENIKALMNSSEPGSRVAAAKFLGDTIGRADAVEALKSALVDKDDNVSWTAEVSLANIKAASQKTQRTYLEANLAALSHKEPGMRLIAAEFLGNTIINYPPAVDALISALKEETDPIVQEAIVYSLAEIGDKMALGAISNLKSDNEWVRRAVRYALLALNAEKKISPVIKELFRNFRPDFRAGAARRLGDFADDPAAIDALVLALGDNNSHVRNAARYALTGKIKRPAAIEGLSRALADEQLSQDIISGVKNIFDELSTSAKPAGATMPWLQRGVQALAGYFLPDRAEMFGPTRFYHEVAAPVLEGVIGYGIINLLGLLSPPAGLLLAVGSIVFGALHFSRRSAWERYKVSNLRRFIVTAALGVPILVPFVAFSAAPGFILSAIVHAFINEVAFKPSVIRSFYTSAIQFYRPLTSMMGIDLDTPEKIYGRVMSFIAKAAGIDIERWDRIDKGIKVFEGLLQKENPEAVMRAIPPVKWDVFFEALSKMDVVSRYVSYMDAQQRRHLLRYPPAFNQFVSLVIASADRDPVKHYLGELAPGFPVVMIQVPNAFERYAVEFSANARIIVPSRGYTQPEAKKRLADQKTILDAVSEDAGILARWSALFTFKEKADASREQRFEGGQFGEIQRMILKWGQKNMLDSRFPENMRPAEHAQEEFMGLIAHLEEDCYKKHGNELVGIFATLQQSGDPRGFMQFVRQVLWDEYLRHELVENMDKVARAMEDLRMLLPVAADRRDIIDRFEGLPIERVIDLLEIARKDEFKTGGGAPHFLDILFPRDELVAKGRVDVPQAIRILGQNDKAYKAYLNILRNNDNMALATDPAFVEALKTMGVGPSAHPLGNYSFDDDIIRALLDNCGLMSKAGISLDRDNLYALAEKWKGHEETLRMLLQDVGSKWTGSEEERELFKEVIESGSASNAVALEDLTDDELTHWKGSAVYRYILDGREPLEERIKIAQKLAVVVKLYGIARKSSGSHDHFVYVAGIAIGTPTGAGKKEEDPAIARFAEVREESRASLFDAPVADFPAMVTALSERFLKCLLYGSDQSAEQIPLELLNDPETMENILLIAQIYARLPERTEDAPRLQQMLLDALKVMVKTDGDIAARKAAARKYIMSIPENALEKTALLQAGYSPFLWEKGVEIEMELSPRQNKAGSLLDYLYDAYGELFDMTVALGIAEISGRHATTESLRSLKEIKEVMAFAGAVKQAIAEKKDVPKQYLERMQKIDQEIRDFEQTMRNKAPPRKFRVVIRKDFLSETTSGKGVPGCFNPNGGAHLEMPPSHALESNAFIVSVYNDKGKQVSNTVVLLTDKGLYPYGEYSSSEYELGPLWTNLWCELVRKKYVPSVILPESSAGGNFAETVSKKVSRVNTRRRGTVIKDVYVDAGSADDEGNVDLQLEDVSLITPETLKAAGYVGIRETFAESKLDAEDAVLKVLGSRLKEEGYGSYGFVMGILEKLRKEKPLREVNAEDLLPGINLGKVKKDRETVLKELKEVIGLIRGLVNRAEQLRENTSATGFPLEMSALPNLEDRLRYREGEPSQDITGAAGSMQKAFIALLGEPEAVVQIVSGGGKLVAGDADGKIMRVHAALAKRVEEAHKKLKGRSDERSLREMELLRGYLKDLLASSRRSNGEAWLTGQLMSRCVIEVDGRYFLDDDELVKSLKLLNEAGVMSKTYVERVLESARQYAKRLESDNAVFAKKALAGAVEEISAAAKKPMGGEIEFADAAKGFADKNGPIMSRLKKVWEKYAAAVEEVEKFEIGKEIHTKSGARIMFKTGDVKDNDYAAAKMENGVLVVTISKKLSDELSRSKDQEKMLCAIMKDLFTHEWIELHIMRRYEKQMKAHLLAEGRAATDEEVQRLAHALVSRIEGPVTELNMFIVRSPELMSDEQLLAVRYDHPNDPDRKFYFAARVELLRRAAAYADKKMYDKMLNIYQNVLKDLRAMPGIVDAQIAPIIGFLDVIKDRPGEDATKIFGIFSNRLTGEALAGERLKDTLGKLRSDIRDYLSSLKGEKLINLIKLAEKAALKADNEVKAAYKKEKGARLFNSYTPVTEFFKTAYQQARAKKMDTGRAAANILRLIKLKSFYGANHDDLSLDVAFCRDEILSDILKTGAQSEKAPAFDKVMIPISAKEIALSIKRKGKAGVFDKYAASLEERVRKGGLESDERTRIMTFLGDLKGLEIPVGAELLEEVKIKPRAAVEPSLEGAAKGELSGIDIRDAGYGPAVSYFIAGVAAVCGALILSVGGMGIVSALILGGIAPLLSAKVLNNLFTALAVGLFGHSDVEVFYGKFTGARKKVIGTGAGYADIARSYDAGRFIDKARRFMETIAKVDGESLKPGAAGAIRVSIDGIVYEIGASDMVTDADFAEARYEREKDKVSIKVSTQVFERIKERPELIRELILHEYTENILINEDEDFKRYVLGLAANGIMPEEDSLKLAHAIVSRVESAISGTALNELNLFIIEDPELMSNDRLLSIKFNHPNDPFHEVFYAVVFELLRRGAAPDEILKRMSGGMSEAELDKVSKDVKWLNDKVLPLFNEMQDIRGELSGDSLKAADLILSALRTGDQNVIMSTLWEGTRTMPMEGDNRKETDGIIGEMISWKTPENWQANLNVAFDTLMKVEGLREKAAGGALKNFAQRRSVDNKAAVLGAAFVGANVKEKEVAAFHFEGEDETQARALADEIAAAAQTAAANGWDKVFVVGEDNRGLVKKAFDGLLNAGKITGEAAVRVKFTAPGSKGVLAKNIKTELKRLKGYKLVGLHIPDKCAEYYEDLDLGDLAVLVLNINGVSELVKDKIVAKLKKDGMKVVAEMVKNGQFYDLVNRDARSVNQTMDAYLSIGYQA